MTFPGHDNARGQAGVEGIAENTYSIIIPHDAETVKSSASADFPQETLPHVSLAYRADEPTRMPADRDRRQSGYVEPHLIGLLSMAAPGAGALMAVVMGWLL